MLYNYYLHVLTDILAERLQVFIVETSYTNRKWLS